MWVHESHAVDYWRCRAEEARAALGTLTSKESCRLMLEAADCYDKLVAKAELAQSAGCRAGQTNLSICEDKGSPWQAKGS